VTSSVSASKTGSRSRIPLRTICPKLVRANSGRNLEAGDHLAERGRDHSILLATSAGEARELLAGHSAVPRAKKLFAKGIE